MKPLMAASGYQANKTWKKPVKDFDGKFICVIEGALPRGLNGKYLTLGPKGKTGIEVAKEVAKKAAAVVCIGSCSAYGNIPSANPNPTDAVGISKAIRRFYSQYRRLSSQWRELHRNIITFPDVRSSASS